MHCSEEYLLVVYSAHSVGKRSERKDGCFHRLLLFVNCRQFFLFCFVFSVFYSRLSLNGHLYKTDTSVKWTPRVGPCLSLLPLFDSL